MTRYVAAEVWPSHLEFASATFPQGMDTYLIRHMER